MKADYAMKLAHEYAMLAEKCGKMEILLNSNPAKTPDESKARMKELDDLREKKSNKSVELYNYLTGQK